MTPLEQIRELEKEADALSDAARNTAMVMCWVGIFLMFLSMTPWVWFLPTWLAGVTFCIPNWAVTIRDSMYKRRIKRIVDAEAYKAMEEKYGREDTP